MLNVLVDVKFRRSRIPSDYDHCIGRYVNTGLLVAPFNPQLIYRTISGVKENRMTRATNVQSNNPLFLLGLAPKNHHLFFKPGAGAEHTGQAKPIGDQCADDQYYKARENQ